MRLRSLALLILPLLLFTAACGIFSSKQAATPAEQALMDTGEKLKVLSADFVKTNAKYVTQCAAPRQIDAVTCDDWVRYHPEFVKSYSAADADWRLSRRSGNPIAESKVDDRVEALAATLKTYTNKTK